MTMFDLEENDNPSGILINDEIPARFHEREGRAFKIVATLPHGHWKVVHAGNSTRVLAIPGEFTTINAAINAINTMPAEDLPKLQTRKAVLTPKVKKDNIE